MTTVQIYSLVAPLAFTALAWIAGELHLRDIEKRRRGPTPTNQAAE